MALHDSFTYFEPTCKVGQKRKIPEKKHLTKQNLACLKCDPSWARTHSSEMTSDLER